jgi:hypothetical protein
MEDEKIKVRSTESGQNIEVLVLSKHPDHIQVLLGEGADSIRCKLLPTPNGRAYADLARVQQDWHSRRR